MNQSAPLSLCDAVFRKMFDTADKALLILDGASLAVVSYNQQAVVLLGLNSVELVDSAPNTYQQHPLFLQLLEHIETILLHSDYQFELVLRDNQGQSKNLQVSTCMFEFEGRFLIRVYVDDVTDTQREQERIKRLYQRLRIATEAAGSGIWELDLGSGHLQWDEQQHRLFGTDPNTFTASYDSWQSCVHPEDLGQAVAALEQAIEQDSLLHTEFRIIRPDGLVRTIEARAVFDHDGQGKPVRMVGVNWDVTERRQTEDALQQAAMIFDFNPEAIMAVTPQGEIKLVNRAFTETTGYRADEAVGFNCNLLKSGMQDQPFYQQMWQQLQTEGNWEGEVWNRRKNGEIYPEWQSIKAIRDDQGEISEYISMFRDITEHKKQEQKIWRQANYDGLTGLANRNLLAERTAKMLAAAADKPIQIGLLLVDLDRFKLINDTLGHEVGDSLLKEVARRLRECAGDEVLVARIGGDEFGLLVANTDRAQLAELCERIVVKVDEPFKLDEMFQYVGCSVGAAYYPDHGVDFSSLLKNADIAMAKAKADESTRFLFFSDGMHAELVSQAEVERNLRRALDNNEFELYYQPIMDVDSDRVIGAEGLIRWNDPEKGLIPPFSFIPVAEECGLIVDIGAWVLEEGVRQLADWHSRGLDLRLSLNVSSIQFQQPGFISHLFGLLRQHELDYSKLVLEVTESIMIDNIDAVDKRLKLIRSMGVKIALDDFGTGYSSLSYLKSLKSHYVKIDRSFIRDCTDNEDDALLVRGIVSLTKGLQSEVIAEGVETIEHLEFLRQIDCEFYQGFLKSPPVPLNQYEAMLSAPPSVVD